MLNCMFFELNIQNNTHVFGLGSSIFGKTKTSSGCAISANTDFYTISDFYNFTPAKSAAIL